MNKDVIRKLIKNLKIIIQLNDSYQLLAEIFKDSLVVCHTINWVESLGKRKREMLGNSE